MMHPGAPMTRLPSVRLFAASFCAAPAFAQPLPPGRRPAEHHHPRHQDGRVVIKLRQRHRAPTRGAHRAARARKFYDNVPFHRVIDGFMAQTGDGRTATAPAARNIRTCGPSSPDVPFERGIVGMARTNDPNSANSQFFIMFADGSASTTSTRWSARWSPAWTWSTRSRRGGAAPAIPIAS